MAIFECEERQLWDRYVEDELGRIIGVRLKPLKGVGPGDPYAFDLRIKILDNGARKALRRAARQALMDEMLRKSRQKRVA